MSHDVHFARFQLTGDWKIDEKDMASQQDTHYCFSSLLFFACCCELQAILTLSALCK